MIFPMDTKNIQAKSYHKLATTESSTSIFLKDAVLQVATGTPAL